MSDLAADLLGHGGYLVLMAGQLAVGRRHRWGFLLRVVGSLVWAGIGAYLGMSSIILWSLGFALVDVVNWDHWRGDGRT